MTATKTTLTTMVAVLLATAGTFGQANDSGGAKTVEQLYPDLAAGALTYAKVAKLDDNILLKSEAGQITLSEVEQAIAEQPAQVQRLFEKNAFFVLEQEASEKLLVHVAKEEIDETSADSDPMSDDQLIEAFIDKLTKDVEATEDEQRAFYDSNPQFFPGVPFDRAQPQVAQYLNQQKKQHFVDDYIRELGKKTTIEVSAEWTSQQASLAKENPLDNARQSGNPAIVLFNATSPCCPDEMGPVINKIDKKFGSELNTVTLNPNTQPILAARYQVRSNPFVILYDADGKEVFRQQGEMSKEQILDKLAEIGLE